MLYFAHGSNLDRPQMLVRCAGARYVGNAKLAGYRLCFPRRSAVRASAIASIEAAKGQAVWGALYEVDQAGLDRLDITEGCLPNRDPAVNTSRRMTVKVERPDGGAADACVHISNAAANPGLPSAGYMLVLVRAAVALGMPGEFLQELRAIEPERLAA
ncbi:hypothetical protein BH10PSE9_BH10PSE9_12290 [soil metagenome]